ncbi:GtrA family protein [Nitrosomonas sp. PY1]|uniref:GtrA family protein n=1 Tax=Nitrosomonas sp. PY1 TaxID=1803906 RepID=UPI001FC8AD6A|nr:GtrA family protein [Nitrosomonas sp. PY1]
MIDREIGRQFTGFSLIGIFNTIIHLVIVTSLVEVFLAHPMPANAIAFICANLFSFWANSRWSFRTTLTHQRYLRFFTVSLIGLTTSILAIAVSETLNWHYLIGVAISFCIMPLLTFVAHRSWTYKK